ncbi:glycosyltransferase family 4 protein [soil metagenome]
MRGGSSETRPRGVPLTVFHIIETSGPGGAETVFVELIRTLDPGRWRSIAVLPPAQTDATNSEWLHDQLRSSGIETVTIEERRSFDLRAFVKLVRTVRASRGALVHGHLFGSAVRASMVSRALSIPSIATLHGVVDIAQNERHLRLKLALVNRGLRKLVFVSETLRRTMLQRYNLPESITTAIPNGIRFEQFTSADGSAVRRELALSGDDFVVGSVGNLTPAKAFDVLLEAAAILAKEGGSYRFVVAGDLKGDQGRRLVELRDSLGLGSVFTFTGFRSDIPQFMAACDVYALTSSSEGFSLALIEAMAAGVAAIATRCGGPEEIIEDGITGLLVQNGSPAAVASAIRRLRHAPEERTRLATNALAMVRRTYSLEANVAAYEQIYDDLTR